MHTPNLRITASGYAGFGIKPSVFRPVYVGFMHIWARITGIRVSFMREGKLSRSYMAKGGLGTAFLVSASKEAS
jgi:hypothetical protein